jgi:hypothetical protein
VRASVLVSSDLGRHAEWLHELVDLGVEDIVLHHVPKPQEAFIEAFGAQVLPELQETP